MELGPIVGTLSSKTKQRIHNYNNGADPQESSTMVRDTESLTTGFNELTHDENGNAQQTTTTAATTESTPATANDNNKSKQISEFDAIQHLIKGNLGPGCLNIPHAFAMSGWILGLFLFSLVAIQGIYSMVLLVYCKQWIRADQSQKLEMRRLQQQQQQQGGDNPNDEHNASSSSSSSNDDDDDDDDDAEIVTFMDVAHATHGTAGSVCVQILLFVLQTGVCCVFLSLIATNLHASVPHWDSEWCVCIVTLLLLIVVLVRDLKELKWLSLGANCLMVTAIGTASMSALWVLFGDNNNGDGGGGGDDENENDQPQKAKKWTKNPAAIAAFISSMFYSFEGIGLVMPVENSFVRYSESDEDGRSSDHCRLSPTHPEGRREQLETTFTANKEEDDRERLRIADRTQRYVSPVLIGSMGTVASLFLLIGATCGPAFPDIVDGSVTAYLTTKYPNSLWYQIVNVGVMVAVFLTFPLQLTPAMEVLEKWFGPGCDPMCCSSGSGSSSSSPWCRCCFGGGGGRHAIVAQSERNEEQDEVFHDEGDEELETVEPGDCLVVGPSTSTASRLPPPKNSCFGGREWIFRRYLVVFGCALVVLTVNDLGLLMSLFGALGNTGLAAMPCIIHWKLVQQGVAPLNFLLLAVDLATIGVSLGVAVIGVAFSVKEILEGR